MALGDGAMPTSGNCDVTAPPVCVIVQVLGLYCVWMPSVVCTADKNAGADVYVVPDQLSGNGFGQPSNTDTGAALTSNDGNTLPAGAVNTPVAGLYVAPGTCACTAAANAPTLGYTVPCHANGATSGIDSPVTPAVAGGGVACSTSAGKTLPAGAVNWHKAPLYTAPATCACTATMKLDVVYCVPCQRNDAGRGHGWPVTGAMTGTGGTTVTQSAQAPQIFDGKSI